MNQEFKSQAELFHALLEGKMLSHRQSPEQFIKLVDGNIFNSDNWVVEYLNLCASDWSIYKKPKKKVKKTVSIRIDLTPIKTDSGKTAYKTSLAYPDNNYFFKTDYDIVKTFEIEVDEE